MPKIDPNIVPHVAGSDYPAPFDEPCKNRMRQRLGDAAGLSQFGVNLLTLPPGAWSSQRHWHSAEDELIWILEGEVVLVTDDGEQILYAGECAGFAASVRNGHHLQNRSGQPARILEIGSRFRDTDRCEYSGIDLVWDPVRHYIHRDGSPYPATAGS